MIKQKESRLTRTLFQKITNYDQSLISRYKKNPKQKLFRFLEEEGTLFFLVNDSEIDNFLNKNKKKEYSVQFNFDENVKNLEKIEESIKQIIQKIEQNENFLADNFFEFVQEKPKIELQKILEENEKLKIQNKILESKIFDFEYKFYHFFLEKKIKKKKKNNIKNQKNNSKNKK